MEFLVRQVEVREYIVTAESPIKARDEVAWMLSSQRPFEATVKDLDAFKRTYEVTLAANATFNYSG